jgi:L-arabinose isomerase
MAIESFEVSTSNEFGDLLNTKRGTERLKIGVYTSAYFEYFRMYPESLRTFVESDVQVVRNHLEKTFGDEVDFIHSPLVVTMDDADHTGRLFKEKGVDMVIFIMFTYSVDVISLQFLRHVEGIPLMIFLRQSHRDIDLTSDYEQTLRNSAMISASQLTGAFKKMNAFKRYEVFIGADDEQRPYDEMYRYCKAYRTYKDLRELNLGIIGHVFRGMFDHEFDRTRIYGMLGPQVIDIQISHLLNEWESVTPGDVDQFIEDNRWIEEYTFVDVGEEDFEKECRFAIAYQRIIERFRLDAACYLGQHFVEQKTGCTGNLSNIFFAKQKQVMTNTEGDINGLIMMCLMNRLTGQTPLFGEWGEFGIRENAMQIMMHGYADLDHAKDSSYVKITGTPENWGFTGAGFSAEFTAKPGVVTVGHFIDDAQRGWRMLICLAESLDTVQSIPCQDVTLLLRPKMPIETFIREILEKGFDHHAIICYGDVTKELGYIADFMQIEKDLL